MVNLIKKIISIIIGIVLSIVFWGCGEIEQGTELIINQFNCVSLEYEELYYNYPLEWFQIYPPFQNDMDDSGVAISQLPHGGIIWYYNPTMVGFWGTNLFDRFINMKDSLYLDFAYRHRNKLIELMDENGYLEYRINYRHYDRIYYNPWYSGIAQGQALSFFSRLAVYAEDSLSEVMAHKVFETLNPYNPISDEVVINDNGFAWIEEYPHNPPDHTFGGFMRAIVGVYDYYHLLKPDEQTANILSAYLTTVKENMYRFRNPGGVYFYDLKYKRSYKPYHQIQVQYLNYLTKISNDSSFAIFADTLKSDYWEW